MSLVELSGVEVLRLDFMQSSYGPWTADVQLDGDVAPAVDVQVRLLIVDTMRVGTVVRSGSPYGQPRCRIVGGGAKLSRTLPTARDYGQIALSSIVTDILRNVGELVGDVSALSGFIVQRYQTAQERASFALQRLLKLTPGLDLWCERNGSFSVRKAPFTVTESSLTRGVLPQENQVVLFGDTGTIEPGIIVSTINGDYKAERVQYELEPMDSRAQLTAKVWYV